MPKGSTPFDLHIWNGSPIACKDPNIHPYGKGKGCAVGFRTIKKYCRRHMWLEEGSGKCRTCQSKFEWLYQHPHSSPHPLTRTQTEPLQGCNVSLGVGIWDSQDTTLLERHPWYSIEACQVHLLYSSSPVCSILHLFFCRFI